MKSSLLICLLAATTVVHGVDYSAAICANPTEYSASCDVSLAAAETPATKSCDGILEKAKTAMFAEQCCGDKVSACDAAEEQPAESADPVETDYSKSICKNPTDWTSTKDLGGRSCSDTAGMHGFTATAKCEGSTMMGGTERKWSVLTASLAAQCCGSSKSSACGAAVDAEIAAQEAKAKAMAAFMAANPTATPAEIDAAGKKAYDASIAEFKAANAPSPSETKLSAGTGHHAGITVAVSILLAVTCLAW